MFLLLYRNCAHDEMIVRAASPSAGRMQQRSLELIPILIHIVFSLQHQRQRRPGAGAAPVTRRWPSPPCSSHRRYDEINQIINQIITIILLLKPPLSILSPHPPPPPTSKRAAVVSLRCHRHHLPQHQRLSMQRISLPAPPINPCPPPA